MHRLAARGPSEPDHSDKNTRQESKSCTLHYSPHPHRHHHHLFPSNNAPDQGAFREASSSFHQSTLGSIETALLPEPYHCDSHSPAAEFLPSIDRGRGGLGCSAPAVFPSLPVPTPPQRKLSPGAAGDPQALNRSVATSATLNLLRTETTVKTEHSGILSDSQPHRRHPFASSSIVLLDEPLPSSSATTASGALLLTQQTESDHFVGFGPAALRSLDAVSRRRASTEMGQEQCGAKSHYMSKESRVPRRVSSIDSLDGGDGGSRGQVERGVRRVGGRPTPSGNSDDSARSSTMAPMGGSPETVPVSQSWVFQRPPNNQRTFFFAEDRIEFSSQFDSGNLIQVERVGPFQYNMYTAMDCGNSPMQTNNRQWFHFSVRGGARGVTVTITFIGMMHSQMFTYDWMPVMAVIPNRPQYTRIPGRAVVLPLETMPETPGYPLLVHKLVSKEDSDNEVNDEGFANDGEEAVGDEGVFSISPAEKPAKKKKPKKKNIAMNLSFEFRIDFEIPVSHTPPGGSPDRPAIYIASNHPYSYSTLQQNIALWQQMASRSTGTRGMSVPSSERVLGYSKSVPGDSFPSSNLSEIDESGGAGSCPRRGVAATPTTTLPPSACHNCRGIYFHREVLCKTLEGHNVTLLTISDRNRMLMERMPLLSPELGVPYSSVRGETERPFAFSGKQYVVLTARVHPGECPASHLMHGCIEFLLNTRDPRAAALRNNFVFLVIPMLNPDGVVRGHSRADANGVDLNRMYRDPSFQQHPAPYSVLLLLRSLRNKVALFIDMHAHANRKGTFFYGNGMSGTAQVDNLLYAKLVSLNTPYLDFNSCNFSEANMFAVGKSGKSKDSSSRVVAFTELGATHIYTIETSHVAAKSTNTVVGLSGNGTEEAESALPFPLPLLHSPMTFADTGRAMLIALLDLKNLNPISRLAATQFHSVRGLSLWLQRQMQIEASEMFFSLAYKRNSKFVQNAVEMGGGNVAVLTAILSRLKDEDIPDKITLRSARLLPRTTFSDVKEFLPIEMAISLLAQTPAAGPPRSLVCGSNGRRRGNSPGVMSLSTPPTATATQDPPPVIASKRTPKSPPTMNMVVET